MKQGIEAAFNILTDVSNPKPSRSGPYFICCGSDKTPDWPFWYIGDHSRYNVLGRMMIMKSAISLCGQLNIKQKTMREDG